MKVKTIYVNKKQNLVDSKFLEVCASCNKSLRITQISSVLQQFQR